jgi:hypothetical protein
MARKIRIVPLYSMALYTAAGRPYPSAGAGQATIGGSSPSSHQLSPYLARSRSLEALTSQPCLASLHPMHLPLGISCSPYPVCLPLDISFSPPPFTPANPSYATTRPCYWRSRSCSTQSWGAHPDKQHLCKSRCNRSCCAGVLLSQPGASAQGGQGFLRAWSWRCVSL